MPYSKGQQRSLEYISTAYTATAVVPPPSPKVFAPRVIKEMFMRMEVTRPAMLFKNTGEPQAAISLNIAKWKRGLTNRNKVFLARKGIIATPAQRHMEMEVAKAEPTTSISNTSKKKDKSPTVTRLEPMLMAMLVFTYPLILR